MVENARFSELRTRIAELKDIDGILGLLTWDEETHAPQGAREQRGQQTATLEGIRHQKVIDARFGELIATLAGDESLSAEEQVMVARIKRRRDLATKLPESLVKEIAELRSIALASWQKARAERNYSAFEPYLQKTVTLMRAKADALGNTSGERYDALLDEFEPGMLTARLVPVLEELRAGLVPLVDKILGAPEKPNKTFLENQEYDVEAQWKMTLKLLEQLGYSFETGRQDRSAHPFTVNCSESDVRVTTRIFPNNPLSAIFSTIHECGHGLYEQGFRREHHRTSLAEVPSAGLHESQSRLWENMIGRSRAFWTYYYPKFAAVFQKQTEGVPLESMYRAVNVVEASPIRVEADEVTYNLHILVRFELEMALISDSLRAGDLPDAWAEKMKKYLGYTPKDDAEGCLQDIHWGWGSFGYFPTYSIGNLYAAQLMAAYEKENPAVWYDVSSGEFAPLLSWLREHVHQVGYLKSAETVISDATGSGLSTGPFLAYLRKKYADIYRL